MYAQLAIAGGQLLGSLASSMAQKAEEEQKLKAEERQQQVIGNYNSAYQTEERTGGNASNILAPVPGSNSAGIWGTISQLIGTGTGIAGKAIADAENSSDPKVLNPNSQNIAPQRPVLNPTTSEDIYKNILNQRINSSDPYSQLLRF